MQPAERMELHKNYHDNHYGFPLHDDNELLGRLIMEINQAGLSWETILKKETSFRKAYNNFNIKKNCCLHRSRQGTPAAGCRDHPQPAKNKCRYSQCKGHSSFTERVWFFRKMAGTPSS